MSGMDGQVAVPFAGRAYHRDPCPGCGHALGVHAKEIGCVEGWAHDEQGHATAEGCECPLALCWDYQPPTEREL